jgi:dTDP-4-dehydrorhamnose 3,5-epimerase
MLKVKERIMDIIQIDIPDVLRIQPKVYQDNRGFFMEAYQKNKYFEAGINYEFVQDNHSSSKQGTLRGLHYQITHTQGKLVRAVIGEIFDVAVDLRRSSPTFGKWVGVILSAENKEQFWIPPGFAHGFFVLSEQADVIYKATDYFDPDGERCLRWDDPTLSIDWPIPQDVTPLVSEKDANGSSFLDAEVFE